MEPEKTEATLVYGVLLKELFNDKNNDQIIGLAATIEEKLDAGGYELLSMTNTGVLDKFDYAISLNNRLGPSSMPKVTCSDTTTVIDMNSCAWQVAEYGKEFEEQLVGVFNGEIDLSQVKWRLILNKSLAKY